MRSVSFFALMTSVPNASRRGASFAAISEPIGPREPSGPGFSFAVYPRFSWRAPLTWPSLQPALAAEPRDSHHLTAEMPSLVGAQHQGPKKAEGNWISLRRLDLRVHTHDACLQPTEEEKHTDEVEKFLTINVHKGDPINTAAHITPRPWP